MSKYFPRITERLTQPATLHGAVELVLVLLLAMQAARLVWIAAAPVGPIGYVGTADGTGSAPEPAMTLSYDPFFRSPAMQPSQASESVLGYKLFGLRDATAGGLVTGSSATGPAMASAIIADDDGNQVSYRVGDEIAEGVTLHAVGRGHALLHAGGIEHRLSLQDTAASTVPARATSLPSAPRADAGSPAPNVDPQELLAQAGLRARTQDGRLNGYTLIPRGDDAVLRQAGLEPGDVLLAVNGQQLTPERLPGLETEMARRDRAEITVQRDGETRTITLGTTPP